MHSYLFHQRSKTLPPSYLKSVEGPTLLLHLCAMKSSDGGLVVASENIASKIRSAEFQGIVQTLPTREDSAQKME